MDTVEKLPLIVLEKIFTYVPDKKKLRLVCKTFKDIIDRSGRLLQNYTLNVSKVSSGYSSINLRIRSLMFERLGSQEFVWIQNYKQKDNITFMIIYSGNRGIEASAEILQYVLLNFKFVQELHLKIYDDLYTFFNPIYHFKNIFSNLFTHPRDKLYAVENSKLEYLSICSWYSINNILSMFSNIPTIKNLEICTYTPPLRFPDKVAWKLEKLEINCLYDDDDECRRIMEGQKSSLKFVNLYSESNVCSYVMKNYPDVESLSLCSGNEDVEQLVPNEKLKSLNLINFNQEITFLEHLLCHFKYLKYLRLDNYLDSELKPLTNVCFVNITHLYLNRMVSSFLMSAKMFNLKNLEIESTGPKNTHDFFLISDENLENVEKLSMNDLKMDQIPAILLKCPKLEHLNVGSFRNIKSDHLAVTINRIISKAPELRTLGILKSTLTSHKMTYYQLISQMDNKKINLMVYDKYKEMALERWNRKYIGTFELNRC